ncbi:MAG: class I SAM-dependent methyltransferase [Candidatus Woesearchaeota archaeon]
MKSLVERKKQDWASRTDCEVYEDEMGSYAKAADQSVVEAFTKRLWGRALDLPCGAGRFTNFLLDNEFQVIGADYNLLMLKNTKKRTGAPVVNCDAFSNPFKQHSFDLLLAMRLVFHYPSQEKLLRSLISALRPGGVLIFDTLNKYSFRYWMHFPVALYRRNPGMALHFRTRQETRVMVRRLGLRLMDHQSRFLLPGRVYQYLPAFAVKLLEFLERILPSFLRGVSYWKAVKT